MHAAGVCQGPLEATGVAQRVIDQPGRPFAGNVLRFATTRIWSNASMGRPPGLAAVFGISGGTAAREQSRPKRRASLPGTAYPDRIHVDTEASYHPVTCRALRRCPKSSRV